MGSIFTYIHAQKSKVARFEPRISPKMGHFISKPENKAHLKTQNGPENGRFNLRVYVKIQPAKDRGICRDLCRVSFLRLCRYAPGVAALGSQREQHPPNPGGTCLSRTVLLIHKEPHALSVIFYTSQHHLGQCIKALDPFVRRCAPVADRHSGYRRSLEIVHTRIRSFFLIIYCVSTLAGQRTAGYRRKESGRACRGRVF